MYDIKLSPSTQNDFKNYIMRDHKILISEKTMKFE